MNRGAVLLLLACCLALARPALSQTSSTSLQGTITDQSGGAIAGATVTLVHAESRTERTFLSDAQGEYRFLFLSPGTYSLRVSAKGFASYEQKGLQLLVSTPATVNLQLKVGGGSEVVTVTGEAPALNMVDASLGNSFNETQVLQIPLDGRNVPELLSLQAGVAYTGNREDMQLPAYKDQDTRSGAVNGARSDQSNITLDGVDVNDQNSGYAFTSILPTTQDSVQEFRVTTTNYDAEQGVGSGAQVSLVTKSGSNDFHGSLYEYNRTTATSANDYLTKSSEIQDCLFNGTPLSDSSCNKPLKLIRNVFGASLGGPIHKDRLFLFANYEGTRRSEEQSAVRTVPSPSLRDGVIQYACAPILDANGNVIQTPTQVCPNTTTVNGISGKAYTAPPGFFAMGPTQITNLDPLNVGPNPVTLAYFNQTYASTIGNDNSKGDGLNYVGFRFRAPVSEDDNVFIARLDYHLTQNGKHLLFWRGALHNLFYPQAPFLPGTPPEQTIVDHSKGFVVGYTAVINSTTTNTFHWGFTRQSTGFVGNTNQPWNVFYTLDTDSHNYSHSFQIPVHNLLDDFSWTKAAHTFQFGTNIGIVRDPRVSSLHSFYQGEGATFWMAPVAFANTGGQSPLDPVNRGFPEPASTTAYDYPMLSLLGMVSLVNTNINYDRQGNVIPEGNPIKRDWGLYWYEFYAQDSWRVRPNLTVTYGVRWSLFPPPWEVNGFQATPTCSNAVNASNGTPPCPSGTFDLGNYFNQNMKNMQNGLGYADGPLVSYVLGGSANNAPGLYHFEKTDFSPRFSIAYSPRAHSGLLKSLFGEGDKTVIRLGFSSVYDRPGMQILNTFDAVEPAGLSSTLQNPCCIDGAGQAARITPIAGMPPISGMNNIPTVDAVGNQYIPNPLPSGSFPQTPKPFGEAITWGIDQSLKTPYAYAIDFSIGRELPKGFSLQLSYVGRLGRRLLTQRDLAQPLNLVDPRSKIAYFAAATAISKLARSQPNPVAPTLLTGPQFDQALGPTVAYWKDLINASGSGTPGLATGATAWVMPSGVTTTDVAQAVYALYVTSGAFAGDEVVGLGNVDLFGFLCDNASTGTPNPACGSGSTANSYFINGKTGELLNQQLTTDYAWSSNGRSNYNGLQTNLRKRLSHGVQFDLNYTYSKSIDFTSGAARLGYSGTGNVGAPGSRLVNAFSPSQVRAVSDFDTTHQINVNWIAELPFGKGRYFGRNSSGLVDAFIGGWRLSGLARWTTGFPFTIDNGQFWATDWDEQGSGQLIGMPKTGAFPQPDGSVSVFANPAAAINDFVHPFPGQSGSRNVLRGDGFASWDTSLSKSWKMPYAEGHRLQFRWEVFNVPNLKRFNVQAGLGDTPTWWVTSVPSHFGDYAGMLTQPRTMQFALRYEF